MTSFGITFSHPWLLLLLIPALALTLIPYFRLSKKYRRTRNRIISLVLHLLVMTLSITVLAGMLFVYTIPNRQNEIILLVDVSATEENAKEDREQFIQRVLKESKYDNYNVGIVTFGFDQNYAVPLTSDVDSVYNQYLNSLNTSKIDVTATNIAAALEYTKGLFNYPETSKIVLITDGKETDEQAAGVIRSVVSQGTSVDVAYVGAPYVGEDIQLTGVQLPDYHVTLYTENEITLELYSNSKLENVNVYLYDNGALNQETGSVTVDLEEGENTVTFRHSFTEEGLHELGFSASYDGENLTSNNQYVTYMDLVVFDKILILEHGNQSAELVKMLNGEENGAASGGEENGGTGEKKTRYDIDVVDIASDKVPTNITELCNYHQVILNNISNAMLQSVQTDDDETTFAELLSVYVKEYGGGMLTVGGEDAYNREDLRGSLYQSMLPVQAQDYSPPVGLVVLVDRSGSMGGDKLEWARAGVSTCLEQMNDRDYLAIVTLDDNPEVVLPLTPVTQEAKIKENILKLETSSGGTTFTNAIDVAGALLLENREKIDKMHIVMITDGGVSGNDEGYIACVEAYYKQDVTLSMIGVSMNKSTEALMKTVTDAGGGTLYPVTDLAEITDAMEIDLAETTIDSVNDYPVTPTVYDIMSPLIQNLQFGENGEWSNKFGVTLGGFYGGKVRASADLVLVGEYSVPLYAQWKYGKGTVGSFMCDLQATAWSSDFMADDNGIQFMRNVVNNLMPVEEIEVKEIVIQSFTEDNYTNHLSIDGKLQQGEYLTATITKMNDLNGGISLNELTDMTEKSRTYYVTEALNAENNYTRCGFIVKEKGVYCIEINKYDANGAWKASLTEYKIFSYSEEYDVMVETDEETLKDQLAKIAEKGNGSLIKELNNPKEIFKGFVTDIEKTFDPRFLFMILAIVFFLLDIAVRKFKFKWISEMVRARKEKKNSQ